MSQLRSNVISFNRNKKPEAPRDQQAAMGPIEAKMRATLIRLNNTQYPDEFDWSVYDRIASKFDEQPRGSVVFNTTFKLETKLQTNFCGSIVSPRQLILSN